MTMKPSKRAKLRRAALRQPADPVRRAPANRGDENTSPSNRGGRPWAEIEKEEAEICAKLRPYKIKRNRNGTVTVSMPEPITLASELEWVRFECSLAPRLPEGYEFAQDRGRRQYWSKQDAEWYAERETRNKRMLAQIRRTAASYVARGPSTDLGLVPHEMLSAYRDINNAQEMGACILIDMCNAENDDELDLAWVVNRAGFARELARRLIAWADIDEARGAK